MNKVIYVSFVYFVREDKTPYFSSLTLEPYTIPKTYVEIKKLMEKIKSEMEHLIHMPMFGYPIIMTILEINSE
jgi:hypothetical protein